MTSVFVTETIKQRSHSVLQSREAETSYVVA